MKDKDSSLIKRLLAYAKPYKWWFLLVLIFMLGSTVADLAKPVLIGNAVDLFTEGYKIPYVEDDKAKGTIEFEGRKLRHLEEKENIQEVSQMLQYKSQYYWVQEMNLEDAKAVLAMTPSMYRNSILESEDSLTIDVNGHTYKGRLLEKEELKLLRSCLLYTSPSPRDCS